MSGRRHDWHKLAREMGLEPQFLHRSTVSGRRFRPDVDGLHAQAKRLEKELCMGNEPAYLSSFEGVRINASRSGRPWACTEKAAGAIAGVLTAVIKEILEWDYGYTPSDSWIRENVRIPFINWLFRKAKYTEFARTSAIVSFRALTSGEVSALFDWINGEGAGDDMAEWIENHIQDIPKAERLL